MAGEPVAEVRHLLVGTGPFATRCGSRARVASVTILGDRVTCPDCVEGEASRLARVLARLRGGRDADAR